MTQDRKLTFFHCPHSRSAGARVLLEELGVPYELHAMDMRAAEQRKTEYTAVNPMGKVPAIRHGDALITEQGAVYLYLADEFPQAGLAPPIGNPQRGPYLRWMFFYGSSFEPALIDRAQKHPPVPPQTCPYGDYDTMLNTLVQQLEVGPYLLGERFSAADVLWGTALGWTTRFGLVPELPAVMRYVQRINARPAAVRVREWDAQLAAEQAARRAADGAG